MKSNTKLIEVALPLEAINDASVRESYIYRGNPSALHKWWAQRPLAAARAVLFAQMVDDPSAYVDALRADPKLRKKAEVVRKARKKVWEEAQALTKKAQAAGLAVSEPGPEPTLDDILAEHERQRLFRIVETLVLWESTTNERVMQTARDEIWSSWRRACLANVDHRRASELFDRHRLPAFYDPFAGGGTLPLEAQRLGLNAIAGELNPVAVLINKSMIDIPYRFSGKSPVNCDFRNDKTLIAREWKGAAGLAEDVRFYGRWMRNEAEKRIGHLYPNVTVTAEMAERRTDLKRHIGESLPVLAWLWARTVKSPNPAFARVDVPLVSTFMLSTKVGSEVHVEPIIEKDGYHFTVKVGKPKDLASAKGGTKLARGANFRCVMSGTPISGDYIKAEGIAGRIGARLMAIVVVAGGNRLYLSPTADQEDVARKAQPDWVPDGSMVDDARAFTPHLYGLARWASLFTSRQLVAMTTFSDLLGELRERVRKDLQRDSVDQPSTIEKNERIGADYADAVCLYAAFAIDKYAMYGNSLVAWYAKENRPSMLFSQQVVPMVWDFTEVNPFSLIGGSIAKSVEIVAGALEGLPNDPPLAVVEQGDAASASPNESPVVISTDPPYYNNVPYADLSDFFYVWLRHSLRPFFPDLFATVEVPKSEELVATPYRHGGKEKAEAFFLKGMTEAMRRLTEQAHPAFPVTIYYAFKQSENKGAEGKISTGWETFLDAVINAGFAISGTWPMRTERTGRVRDTGSNALASSIVLVCRARAVNAPSTTRREFVAALKGELPRALSQLQRGNIAPVDLAQAAIGPGMAVFTRYSKVLDTEGKALTVREALALINQTLDEALSEQEGDFDADSRWALAWFEQSGFTEGEYGVAEQLSKSKNTTVNGMVKAGIIDSNKGKVRLLRPEELPADWDPAADSGLSEWEIVHHLIRALATGGEGAAAEMVTKLGATAEIARELAYRLYTVCERKKRAAEALAYNGLVQSWPEIVRLASDEKKPRAEQVGLFAGAEG